MHKASEFLGRVVRRMERPEAALAWLESSWPDVVGKALAAHTRPIQCASGRLEVAIDGKAWQKQAEAIRDEFCARVNQAWGGNLIREVRFVAPKSTSPKLAREVDNGHTPFVRRRS